MNESQREHYSTGCLPSEWVRIAVGSRDCRNDFVVSGAGHPRIGKHWYTKRRKYFRFLVTKRRPPFLRISTATRAEDRSSRNPADLWWIVPCLPFFWRTSKLS